MKAKILLLIVLLILIGGCESLGPDGFSIGVLTTRIPGGPGIPGLMPGTESQQIYGLTFALNWTFAKK